ncbi:CubicO group peptidase (beta-lactamase class C family) [Novosphingobium sp. GV055]|nr:CubicO group peptidase (beta-lactamase class C family) [Novosphingobium sp. GV055]PUB01782.1 CubicO group peptidase (beta-lactamase class C family) [Novosphingobium sp. GV061]PUB17754.1 CubicO group peptidase (beta-lactamase class C family) [Novosphingobium sp. GV079]PUB40448.1 CubicO group peptidase (beta-lactamase class C family) [Novosphingobium sp. GV027]
MHDRMTLPQTPALSRRGLLGGAGLLGGGLLLQRWAHAAPTDPRLPAITGLLDDYVGSGKLAGAVATLGWGDAPPEVVARGTGTRGDARPLDENALFRIYSMTKPITGMAAMILIDEGKLGLDQPIADFLPAYAHMNVLVDPAGPVDKVVPATAPITVRQLLTHTAGLGYTIIQTGPIRDAYAAAGIMPYRATRVPLPGFGEVHTAPSLAAFADNLARLPLVYQPGTRWSYSVALDLMGRIIELASGQEFSAFLKARFFDPLGMDSTTFQLAPADVPRFTTNYVVADGRLLPIDGATNSVYLDPPAFPFGGAGLISSPRDYDRFLAMLLGGGVFAGKRVMSQRAVDMGTSNLLPPGASTAGTWIAGHGFGAGGRVGLGDSAGTYGWSGAAGTIGFISKVGGVRGGFFAQFMPSTAYPFDTAFPQAVRSDVRARLLAQHKVAA